MSQIESNFSNWNVSEQTWKN